jgi:Flp pilus assembly protein TadB
MCGARGSGNQSGQSVETLIRLAASAQTSLESPGFTGLRRGNERTHRWQRRGTLALLIVLALIVALFIGLGFVVKWLFIIAVIAALIWLIAFFTGRARA